MSAPYPHLRALLGGWFHQDFDIEGETPEEVMAAYRRTASADERDAVRADILAFLSGAAGDLDAAFASTFQPDVDPAAWGLDARGFLERLAALA